MDEQLIESKKQKLTMQKTKILYISYNGMHEPLGASQVLSYLYKLSIDYEYHLISLEKPKDFADKNKMESLQNTLRDKGIFWHPMEYKTSKIGKIGNFARLLQLTRKTAKENNIRFAHCRGYFPAFAASLLGLTYLFDTRGFAFDESADVGTFSRNSLQFKILKRIEKSLYRNAAAINKLSVEGKRTIVENELFENGDQIQPISVIPTCVDLDRFQFIERNFDEPVKIGYVGTAIGWYDFDRTLKVLVEIGKQMDYRFIIFNGEQHDYIQSKLKEYAIPLEKVQLEKVAFQDMPARLADFDISLFYIHPFFSKRASAATKLGELFATGIPVLTNAGVGDHEYYINNFKTGKILNFDESEKYNFVELLANLRTIETAHRCRNLAEECFSIDKAIENYKQLYRKIFI